MSIKKSLGFFVAGLVLAISGVAQASLIIGVKYNMGNSLLPTDNVGAPGYEQPYWTMAPGGQVAQINLGGLVNLKDNTGAATSVSVTKWTGTGNSWHDGPPLTTEQKLLSDYCANSPSVELSGLNSFAPSGYMVVAYYDGSNATTVKLTAGAYVKSRNVAEGVLGTYTFAWHEGTDSNYHDGQKSNYTVFGTPLAPLTSDIFTVEETNGAQGWVGGLAAFQIVQIIPEPSTFSLLGLAALGLLSRAWRRFRA